VLHTTTTETRCTSNTGEVSEWADS